MSREPAKDIRFLLVVFVILTVLVVIGVVIAPRAHAQDLPFCRIISYEPGRPSSARLSLELTRPDATATPPQRLDCACREWP